MRRYTTLLMDADETLLDFERSEQFALSHTLKNRLGVTLTEEMRLCYHRINATLWRQLERGELTRDRLRTLRFEEWFTSCGLPHDDAAAFNADYMQAIGLRGYVLDGAIDLLERLSKHYSIHIITNGTACVQHTRLADSGLLPFVDRVFISEEIGADKPSPAFFDHVLSSIGSPRKEDVLIIGDSPTSDIRGGMLSCIDTCWFDPHGATLPDGIAPTTRVSSYEELLNFLDA